MLITDKHRIATFIVLLCLWQTAFAQLTLTTNNTSQLCQGSSVNLNAFISTNGSFILWSEKPPALDVAAGVLNNVAVLSNGNVEVWGSLSNSTAPLRNHPNLTNAKKVAAGRSQMYALLDNGTVVGWGDNDFGQLNIPTFAAPVVQIATAREYALAVLSNGTVVGWGDNANGVLNIPTFAAPVVQVATGREHNLALLNNGTVVGWGSNSHGQLNSPNFASFGGTPVAISAGLNFSVALLNNGTILCWGDNALTQAPPLFGAFPNVKALASGNAHSIILLGASNAVGWGTNTSNQTAPQTFPKPVVDISAGSAHNLALFKDGSVAGWGETTVNRADPYNPVFIGSNPTVTPTQTKTYYVTVGDNAGNVKYGSVTVLIDNTPPVINCPPNYFFNTSTCSTPLFYSVNATDNCTTNPTVSFVSGLPAGSDFPIGTTTNVFKATDALGNSSTCSFTVTVRDVTPPTVVCPSPITVNSGSDCSERVVFNVTAQDNCQIADTVGLTSLGSIGTHRYFVSQAKTDDWNVANADAIARGGHLVTITSAAENALVASANARMFIGFVRTEPNVNAFKWVTGEPFVYTNWATGEPNNLNSVEDVGELFPNGQFNDITVRSFTQRYAIEFEDLSATTLTIDSIYTAGVTNKTVTIADAVGNKGSCTVRITVVDTANPTITCPATLNINTDAGSCTAVATFAVTATDNCSATVTQTSGLASGSAFPIGTTFNTFTATDPSGNTATCRVIVSVADREKPVITCPANQNFTVDACGVAFNYSVTATDNCSATVTQTSGVESGRPFLVGITNNIFAATDLSGNVSSCSFTVTVRDTTPPTITCPTSITVSTDTGLCSSLVNYNLPTASDGCTAFVIPNPIRGLASGSRFPIGTTSVIYQARDASNNTSTCSFMVTVTDNEKPVITCPTPLSKTTDLGVCGAKVTFANATATDNCSATVRQTSGLASDAIFPVGTSTVVFTATDASNNTSTCSFTVKITDNETPTITAPAAVITVPNTTACTATGVSLGTATASDNCSVVVSNNAPSAFPVGNTIVIWTATDPSGNTATATQTVTVNPVPTPSVSGGSGVCTGATLTLTGSATTGTFTWTSSNTALATVSNTGVVTGIADGTVTITYTITQNNCSASTTKTIVVTATPPVPNLTVVAPTCMAQSGGSITITNLPAGYASQINGGVATVGKTVYTGLAAGTYTIKLSKNGCESSKTATVTEILGLDPTKCYKLTNRNSGLVLEVFGATPFNFGIIHQNPNNNQTNQKWQFSALGNDYFKVQARHSNKVLSNQLNLDNSFCYQYDYFAGGTQDWKLECNGNGYYRLQQKSSGKYLSVVFNLTTPLAQAVIQTLNTSNNAQQWKIEEVACGTTTNNLAAATRLNFEATAEANQAKLTWVSNLGSETDFFTVQKLNEKTGDFEKLAVQNNPFTDNEVRVFTAYDPQPTEGENTYRIELTLTNGEKQLTAAKTLMYRGLEEAAIFPNPATEEVFIDLNPYEGRKVSLSISDISGKTLLQDEIEKASIAPYRLDLGGFQTGLYFVKIQAQGRKMVTKKLQIGK